MTKCGKRGIIIIENEREVIIMSEQEKDFWQVRKLFSEIEEYKRKIIENEKKIKDILGIENKEKKMKER